MGALRHKRYLVVVIEDHDVTVAGGQLLVNMLDMHGQLTRGGWEVVVLVPSWARSSSLTRWRRSSGLRFDVVAQEPVDTPYAAKFVLLDFLRTLDDSDEVLYMDYDHLCLGSIDTGILPSGALVVGCEVTALSAVFLRNRDPARYSLDLPDRVYNNSLIYGTVGPLRTAMRDWQAFYDRFRTLIPDRFREEVAFTAAAQGAGCAPISAPHGFQSTWASGVITSQVVHYGGVCSQAIAAKRTLESLAAGGQCGEEDRLVLSVHPLGATFLRAAERFTWP